MRSRGRRSRISPIGSRIGRRASSWSGTTRRCMSDDVRIDSDCWPLQRVVTHRLPPGIYEDLLTTALEAAVDARKSEGWRMDVSPSDATAHPEFLARLDSCDARWKRFQAMTMHRPRLRSTSRTGWWRCSSRTAHWPTTESQRLRDCSSRPPNAVGWAAPPLQSPARRSLFAKPAFSSTGGAISRLRARSRERSECRSNRSPVCVRPPLWAAIVPGGTGRTDEGGSTSTGNRERLHRVDRTPCAR